MEGLPFQNPELERGLHFLDSRLSISTLLKAGTMIGGGGCTAVISAWT